MADENINIILESDDEELDLTNDDGEMILTDDGSAGGGTNDYNKLKNKPSINGVILQGNRTTEEIFPDLSGKADKRDTVLETTLSRGRRAGSTVGDESLAFGENVEASGYYSQAFGYETTAIGPQSHAEGRNNTAYGSSSHAEGTNNVVNGSNAHVEGYESTAVGNNAHAEGYSTTAGGYASHVEGGETSTSQYGTYAHAEGHETSANAQSAHAEGEGTFASMQGSHAEGYNTQANGIYAHAEGTASQSNGYSSHAEGGATKAQGSSSHSEGYNTSANGAYSHAEGAVQVNNETKTYNGTTYSRGANGYAAHSEGYNTVAHGDQSHAEGNDTFAKAQYSHAEGYGTIASDSASHAEGGGTISSGTYSHSEGNGTRATEYSSHAEGAGTTASGSQSHAEGGGTTASGGYSHAEGGGTTASGGYSHSEGSGTQATGSNSHAEGASSQATGSQAHAEGTSTHANGPSSHAEGSSTYAEDYAAHAEGGSTHANAPMSHAEGGNTIAAGTYSHVGGTMNVEDSYDNWPEWVSGSEYSVGDKVKITTTSGNDTTITAYICKTPNSDTTFTAYKWDNQQGKMNYAEIIGNGIYSRSNARALDWDGNERLAGNLYVGCNNDSTGGNKVATEAFVTGKIGSANGIASLDQSGKVPSSQLPSYVDDVLEYASISAFPETGESGKIYVALDTNKTYRWSGSAYVQISESLALGETEQTAYRGDRGKAAYDHAALKGTAYTAGFYKIGTNSEGHVDTATQVTKNDIVSLGIAPAIMSEVSGYSHENVDHLTFVGNAYAFGNARYADKKNLIIGYDKTVSQLSGAFTFVAHRNIIVINGTRTSGTDVDFWEDTNVDIPAGSYTFRIEPYVGSSTMTNGKKMYLDLWYDGNTSDTYDVRVPMSGVKDVPVSNTFTTTNHVWKIHVWVGAAATNVYNDYRLFYSLLPSDAVITDTGETVANGETLDYTFDSVMTVVDTLMHSSDVIDVVDTKTYVDTHIPDVDFVCFRPEDYGAKGDGETDDSTALQACINAAQAMSYSKACAIRGYGTYMIGTGIVFECRELDVYLNKIIYTGNDAAVTISAMYSKFEFQSIRAFAGGNAAVGIRCYQTTTQAFYHNIVKCNFIRSNGNTIEFKCANDVTTYSMMYNQFFFEHQWSANANIIHIEVLNSNENDFNGKLVRAENGYLYHVAPSVNEYCNGNRLYHYCLENYLLNGTNGSPSFYFCRSGEMENQRTIDNPNRGFIYSWENCVPMGEYKFGTGGVAITSIDVTNAYSWQDALDAVKAIYDDNPSVDPDEPWSTIIPSSSGTGIRHAEIYPVDLVANSRMRSSGGSKCLATGKVVVYYNNVAFKPDDDVYYKVDADMTIELTDSNNWEYITPTTFDIDGSSTVTIYLDPSYCCIAINEFDLIQHTGKEAIVVDKNGNTIFDGTGRGAGVFHFKCKFVEYESGDVSITTTGGTVKNCPKGKLAGLYSGSNEKWIVTKTDLVE